MGHHPRRESFSGPFLVSRKENEIDSDLVWPFGKLDGLDHNDIREAVYEIFFTACRSSPGFGGRNALSFYSSNSHDNGEGGGSTSPTSKNHGVGMIPTSKVKRALGLKMARRSPSKRMSGGLGGSAPTSPTGHHHSNSSTFGSGSGSGSSVSPGISLTLPLKPKRPMTSAEIMRQQMRVTEQSDTRLRKTLMRTLVGQMGRRAETIILPLELLRHLKPSEFNDSHEYHLWQKRQLKVLEVGLLVHPSIPLDKSSTFAVRLREIIRSGESKSIDTGKNSDTMRTLCNSVVSLSWRSTNGAPTDVCHWADGFPFNVHLYCSLLQAIFDPRDETLVLDEVDELLELMKKTWCTLGLNRQIHNVCFTWVLFQQYVNTSQLEPDLLGASLTMLNEVATDAKKPDREANYVKILSAVLSSMQAWSEKKLLRYHDYFQKGAIGLIENLLPLALSASKILGEDVTITGQGNTEDQKENADTMVVDISGDRVDYYIRSSVKNAFNKITDSGNINSMSEATQDSSEALIQLAKETEDLAFKERECFTPTLKKWHTVAAGVAAVTLHNCYGNVLKQYLGMVETLTTDTVAVLQRAGKLEKTLVQMVVEDTVDCEDGGKGIVREMVPYEVDTVILDLLKQWIDDRLKRGKEYLNRAKETETWNPKSKNEPYAQSAVEMVKLAKDTVEEFFEIPIGITDDLVQELADGLEQLIGDYIGFVSSCGSKQSYMPSLPPLTRCNRDSKLYKLWKKAAPCSVVLEDTIAHGGGNSVAIEAHHPRPLTSRGTQRLYIRLNTLHYVLAELHTLDKSLSLSPRMVQSSRSRNTNSRKHHGNAPGYFDHGRTAIQTSCQNVSEVAAYRLIFLDSSSVLYESLYAGDVARSRIKPALRALKQSMTLLTAMVTERAQPVAMKEVMKASFDCYLMVLLAGGPSRVFQRSDHEIFDEDFQSLKRVFCSCGEGLISEDFVDREAEVVEGVISLFGQSTEQLMEDFSIVACETSGIGVSTPGQKLPMPPTTGRWNRTDPNTILRVLCYRDDKVANQFLKRSFQLAKRR